MENSKIAWCDHTLNFWIGCSHAVVPESVSTTGKAHESPECKACYAEQLMDKRFDKVTWGKNGTRTKVKSAVANARKWNKQAKLTGDRPRVFCQSLSDTFEDFEGLDEWRSELFELIDECDHLEWLLLSKHLFDRMANGESWRTMFPKSWGDFFPNHVRIGCTTGTQETYNYRTKFLQRIPAKNFVSIEPMVESMRLGQKDIDWIIVGGESKQGSLPTAKFDLEWAIDIRDQISCDKFPTPPAFFFKQAGSNPYLNGEPLKLRDRNGEDLSDPLIPSVLKIREFPLW